MFSLLVSNLLPKLRGSLSGSLPGSLPGSLSGNILSEGEGKNNCYKCRNCQKTKISSLSHAVP